MLSQHFKLIALGAILLHLGDGLLATRGHSHGPHGHHACHQSAEHAGPHHHHGECAHHDHEERSGPTQQEHSLPGHDDADHCAACRHLAQAAAHQFVLVELPTAERVAPLCPQLELAELSHPAHAYLSRGPPAIAL